VWWKGVADQLSRLAAFALLVKKRLGKNIVSRVKWMNVSTVKQQHLLA
jgi:hypothetical protein